MRGPDKSTLLRRRRGVIGGKSELQARSVLSPPRAVIANGRVRSLLGREGNECR